MEIGKGRIVDEYGEVKGACRVVMPSSENWDKAWFGSLLLQCGVLGIKPLSILIWMISNRDYNSNKVIATQREIGIGSGASIGVTNKALRDLCDAGIIRKIQNGVHMINPAIVVRGDTEKQRYLLIEFNRI